MLGFLWGGFYYDMRVISGMDDVGSDVVLLSVQYEVCQSIVDYSFCWMDVLDEKSQEGKNRRSLQ